MVQAYTLQSLQGHIDYDQLGRIFRPDQQIPAATVRRLLKQPRIQEMIDEEMSRVLSRHGLTVEQVLEQLNDAVRLAKQEGDLRVLRDLVFKMAEMLGMVPR